MRFLSSSWVRLRRLLRPSYLRGLGDKGPSLGLLASATVYVLGVLMVAGVMALDSNPAALSTASLVFLMVPVLLRWWVTFDPDVDGFLARAQIFSDRLHLLEVDAHLWADEGLRAELRSLRRVHTKVMRSMFRVCAYRIVRPSNEEYVGKLESAFKRADETLVELEGIRADREALLVRSGGKAGRRALLLAQLGKLEERSSDLREYRARTRAANEEVEAVAAAALKGLRSPESSPLPGWLNAS